MTGPGAAPRIVQAVTVIARPFVGSCAADFQRTSRRHDFSLNPPAPTLLDKLQEDVGVPILHMIRETAQELARQGKKRPGILATDGTIRTGLYQKECAAVGMEAVAPDALTQRLVMSIIYDEIKQGEQGSREKFAHIDRAIRRAGCDCAILACTELSVFSTYHSLPPFYLDAMAVLAQRAVTACGYPLRTI